MIKWYHTYEITHNYISVLKCNHAITLADESARLCFTAVKWYRGVMVMWYSDTVVPCHLTTIVAMYQNICAWASCKLGRAGAAAKNLT